MKFGIIVFPGSNCDRDCYHAARGVLGHPAEYIWHGEKTVEGCDCIILPGGFSYGDYLRAGAIARFSPVMGAVMDFAEKGGLILGICNGFQILLEAGLLPGAMLRNKNTHFVCKYVYIRTENNGTRFTGGCGRAQVLRVPIAHSGGRYYIDESGHARLRDSGRIVFRYCSENGGIGASENPNGSLDNIAGIINERGNVLGMMPHPERSVERVLGSEDGRFIFESLAKSQGG